MKDEKSKDGVFRRDDVLNAVEESGKVGNNGGQNVETNSNDYSLIARTMRLCSSSADQNVENEA